MARGRVLPVSPSCCCFVVVIYLQEQSEELRSERSFARVPRSSQRAADGGEGFFFFGGFGSDVASSGESVQPADRGRARPSHLWDRHGRRVLHGARKRWHRGRFASPPDPRLVTPS